MDADELPPDAGPAERLGFSDGLEGKPADAVGCRPNNVSTQQWTVPYAREFNAGVRRRQKAEAATQSPALYLLLFSIVIGIVQYIYGGFLPTFDKEHHFGFH